jgi:uncharacterized lipoprotein YddW (UPF0748 family)
MTRTYSIIFYLIFISVQVFSQNNDFKCIRGTWVTNVASNAMLTEDSVRLAVQKCKLNGLTDIFVVVWNDGLTTYPSKVVQKYIGVSQNPIYKNFDPLSSFVSEGHKAGLRVHAWFEFGFSYAYKDSSVNGWLTNYPHWAGKDKNQSLLKKNGFFWWNSLHPEVQDFIQQLVLEVVRNYNIDGIQGDDRLPAMPSEGGYDAYTLNLFASENNGMEAPLDSKNKMWLQWRANKLNQYIKSLYKEIKLLKSNCTVSWAPSIFPWSLEQYLQDWPTWLKEGYADIIIPQVYRYQFESYSNTLKAVRNYVPENLKYKVFPGILTSLGDGYRADSMYLKKMIQLNRDQGYCGEVLFYYETIKDAILPIY